MQFRVLKALRHEKAIQLQAHYRSHAQRQENQKRLDVESRAATKVQGAARGRMCRTALSFSRSDDESVEASAATTEAEPSPLDKEESLSPSSMLVLPLSLQLLNGEAQFVLNIQCAPASSALHAVMKSGPVEHDMSLAASSCSVAAVDTDKMISIRLSVEAQNGSMYFELGSCLPTLL